MLPGEFVGGDVRELTTYAIVGGVRREIESVSLDRALAGDLPEQVVSGGGVAGSAGTIIWASAEDVQVQEVSPWHKVGGWPPAKGDRVQVYVTDGTTSWPRFTGVIDATSGTVGGGMQSTVIDSRDRLNTTFTQPALLRHMTPSAEGSAYRSIGLSQWHALMSALRAAGIYNTPPMVSNVAVSAPLQGSAWPEAGSLRDAQGLVEGNHAQFYQAPWGHAAGGFLAHYLPRTSELISAPLQVTMVVAPEHLGTAFVSVYFSDTVYVQLQINSSWRVTATYVNGATTVEVLNRALTNVGLSTTLTLLVKGGVWDLRTSNGERVFASQAVSGGAAMDRVYLSVSESARVAGVQVSRPLTLSHEFSSLTFVPSCRFTISLLALSMDMSPRIESRGVSEVVDEICKATLTAAWWDESGVLQLVPSDRMRSAEPVQSITTLDDITAMGWEDSLLSVRSKVEVTWKDPAISKGRFQRKELFRGPGDTMEAQDNIEVFATPDDSTEWFGVDRNPRRLDDSNWGVYNRKRGSFTGVYYMDSTDNELPSSTASTAISVESMGTVALKVSHTAGALGTGIEASLGTSENATAIRPYLRGQNLPVIRGFGAGRWMDAVHVSSITGPSYAPALTHDLGCWGHEFSAGGSVAQRLADFIAGQVTSPVPTLTDVSVLYDPRRQLGDVITIQSGILDVTIRALVVAINESHAPGDHGQSLTVRIISVTSTRKVTYAEFEAAWAGSNYAAMEAAWSGLTYTNFENDPLEGAPNA